MNATDTGRRTVSAKDFAELEEAVAELVGVGLALVEVLREDSASPPSVWSAALAVDRSAS